MFFKSFDRSSTRVKDLIWVGVISLVSLGGYLIASRLTQSVGFPLDDAWIHQTYARNLGVNGEWSFIPGQASAGSTAPLWTMVLAIGHALGTGPFLWTFLINRHK